MSKLLHLRMNDNLVAAVDTLVKSENYSSRTEFIAEATRKQGEEKKKTEEAIKNLRKYLGCMKGQIKRLTKEEKKQVFDELMRKKAKGYNVFKEFGLE